MCGIVAAVAHRDIVPLLLEGLRRLEYRGYDSAGISVLTANNELIRIRHKGRVDELNAIVTKSPLSGFTGIAHTRWATHGQPSEQNAHPHVVGNRLALVHNGIIENYEEIREQITAKGFVIQSETDSELIAWCIFDEINQGFDLLNAVAKALKKLKGTYAFAVIDAQTPGKIIGARLGPPLIVGIGQHEYFLTSDTLAIQREAEKFIYLEDGDIVEISYENLKTFQENNPKNISNPAEQDEAEGVRIYNGSLKSITRKIKTQSLLQDAADKSGYPHFMLKEIFEQPTVILDTLEGRLFENRVIEQAFGVEATAIFDKVQKVQIVACGTSFHAGLLGRLWLESLAGIPCQVEIASEFRYRKRSPENGNTLYVAISQSGETADTLAALRNINPLEYCGSLGICNVPNSSLARETDLVFMTHAGPEIGVCSTKSFTAQLMALFLLTMLLGRRRGLQPTQESMLMKPIIELPEILKKTLALSEKIKEMAKLLTKKTHALFLGRGLETPIAQEGALKLKEISYIHAEAYPAGELKHGPLALVDANMPIIVVAPNDSLIEKLKSNIQEVHARKGELIILTPRSTHITAKEGIWIIEMPEVEELYAPFVYSVALQLFAYHVAIIKGTDVDKPRNLAKSVTVE